MSDVEGEIKEQFWPTFKYQEDFLKMVNTNIFSLFAASSKSIIQNEKLIPNDQVWDTLMTVTDKNQPIFEF